MGATNSTVRAKPVFTHNGAPAVHEHAEGELRRAVMSCLLWEDSFYENGVDIAKRIAGLVTKVKPEIVAEIAEEAKHEMKLRHVPLYLTVLLAGQKYNVRELTNSVVTRADDLTEILSIYWTVNRTPKKKAVSNSLLRGLKDAIHKFDEYALSKYKKDNKAVKLKDVIKLAHPKPINKKQAKLWKQVIDGTLKPADTWEVGYSACKTNEEKKKVWEDLVAANNLGGLATLRNIRNMKTCGSDPAVAIKKIKAGKLLPINFLKAAEVNPDFEPQIEQKFLEVFDKKEKISGKTILLIDVSGSMEGKNSNHAGGLAMIAREMFDDLRVFIFGNNVREVPARRGFALKDAVAAQNEGTQLGAAISKINTLPHDRLIVITDEQSSDIVGKPVAKDAYMINIASYRNGVANKADWTKIDGWSDRILNYLVKFEDSKKEVKKNKRQIVRKAPKRVAKRK